MGYLSEQEQERASPELPLDEETEDSWELSEEREELEEL